MAHLHIDDLAAAQTLTPEELEQIMGAGRASARPTVEALEGRELYAVSITGSVTPQDGVLHLRTRYVPNTVEQDIIATARGTRGQDALALLRGASNEIVALNKNTNQVVEIKGYDPKQTVRAIDLVMEDQRLEETQRPNLDFTGLGKLNNDGLHLLPQGKADVSFIDQAGRYVEMTNQWLLNTDVIRIYDKAPGGHRTLLERQMVNIDGWKILGVRQDGKWIQRIYNSTTFQWRIDVSQEVDGPLLSQSIRENGDTITYTYWMDGRPIVTKFSASVDYSDDTQRITTVDGLKVYQRVGNDWKLISSRHQEAQGWVEESWGLDGTYTRNVYTAPHNENYHERFEGSGSHIMKTVVKDGLVTAEVFHAQDVKYASQKLIQQGEAKVTFRYSLNADGTPKELLMYDISPASAPDYLHQTWTKEGGWQGVAEPWKGWAGIYGGNGSPTLQTVARFLPSGPLNAGGQQTLSNLFLSVYKG